MRISSFLTCVGIATSLGIQWVSWAAAQPDNRQGDRPYGINKRVPWSTSRVKGSPEPPAPYRTEPAFPKLKFAEPLDMEVAPGSDRLFVVERYGKIFSFPNDPKTEQAELFLDLGKVIYGLSLHPQFQKNGYCYITYIIDPKEELPLGTRVSRFRVSRDNPWRCDPDTEQVLIEWPSGGHNGGCLQFGPDGYLYIATGDSSGIADEYQTGQDMGVLAGKILRIDVDHHDEGKAYAIPKDNPFVGVEGARPEIWAYGLRQPWKMSFDRRTGELWTGNVGQDLWEQIYRIERGGNYGWSVMEGSHPFRPERKRGPSSILMPIIEHSHADFRSITGGFVYRGSRLKELVGAYIYGDYDTGRIWTFRYDGKQVSEHRELYDSNLRLVGFAQDKAGELLLVDHMGGGIHRISPNPAAGSKVDFPRKLSDTGLFASVKDHRPAAGLIPYSIIAPAWSDGAHKDWYLALPGESQIEFEAIEFPQPAPGAPRGWKFPDGAVVVETISLEMERGKPASRRRLETRILHNERLTGTEEVGDQYWRGYTFVWNDEQTDAVLLDAPQGQDRTYTIRDPAAPDGKRRQTWHFPSRAECTTSHNMAAKYTLGVTTLQMNKDHDYGGVVDNQLRTLEHIGIFTKPLPSPPEELPRLANYRDSKQDLDRRGRSYLHANCSYCHRKWGGGNAEFQFLYTLDLEDTKTLVRPAQGTFYIPDAQVLAPGDPYRSVLFYRMANLGPGRMPRMGSVEVDEQGLRVMHDWIAQLSPAVAKEAKPSATTTAGGQPADAARAEATAALKTLRADSTAAEDRSKAIDRLLASTTGALRLVRAIDEGAVRESVRNEVIARATQHSESHVRDLFERFLPAEQRTKRLGSVIKPEEILSLFGDIERGRKFFFEAAGVQCRNCHRIQGQGGEVGPDLSEIGKKLNRAQILESILLPSKDIDPKYLMYLVETKAGLIYTGVLVEKTETEVSLRDAQNKLLRLSAADIERMAPQQQSIMPELLLRDMTAPQVADLTEFLSSLK
ncbi:MAG: PQQ-dependent sugar dehydrogenase [Planctomycetes bacterium]|nr:PQQ-dependent sugar dehydrogenase [Planctomycetota bacterium]